MGRVHLFEFEDQAWFPDALRNYGTDFLQFLANKTKMYKAIVPVLEQALKKSRTSHILDLASGGGGGLIWLNSEIRKTVPTLTITLTDYFPNFPAFEYTKRQADNINFIEEPVDARDVPARLQGLRTQFLSFHHFMQGDAKRILQNAIDSKCAIAVFEAQERSVLSLLAMLFSPITVLLTTPFIRPFKVGRIIFTYLIPIVPLFVWWDGLISCVRTYSVMELNQLIDQLKNKERFEWETKRISAGPGVIIYLVGTPKSSDET